MTVNPLAIRDKEDNATKNRHGTERHYDRRYVEFPYHKTIEHTHECAHADRHCQYDRHGDIGGNHIDHCHHHAGQRQVCSNT